MCRGRRPRRPVLRQYIYYIRSKIRLSSIECCAQKLWRFFRGVEDVAPYSYVALLLKRADRVIFSFFHSKISMSSQFVNTLLLKIWYYELG